MIKDIVNKLYMELPDIARTLLYQNKNLTEIPQELIENPDSEKFHDSKWHQWGIISHTKNLEKVFREELVDYLEEWKMKEKILSHMKKEIDNIEKLDLFVISMVLHDIGKYLTIDIITRDDGSEFYKFKDHEKASGNIIRDKEFADKLKKYGLTLNQMEYIARTAELHFELGILRKKVKETEGGFTLECVKNPLIEEMCRKIISDNEDFKFEIGIFFLIDNLGKMDMRIKDENNEMEIEKAKKEIEMKNLHPNIINGVIQLPINIAFAKKYFDLC